MLVLAVVTANTTRLSDLNNVMIRISTMAMDVMKTATLSQTGTVSIQLVLYLYVPMSHAVMVRSRQGKNVTMATRSMVTDAPTARRTGDGNAREQTLGLILISAPSCVEMQRSTSNTRQLVE